MKEPVTILIPTYNNPQYLQPCLISLTQNVATKGLYNIIVVNNGHERSCDWIGENPMVSVVNTGENLGWEGGLKEGLKHTKAPYIIFMNDDTFVPPNQRLWVNRLIQHFKRPEVGAVGTSSNVVMGHQNIFAQSPAHIFHVNYLIGFCLMVSRVALEKAGGIDDTLCGGDDIDLSIRLRKAGYKLLVDKDTFIYHHGFKTGERVHGSHDKTRGWNSIEFTEDTNFALINKHGFETWYNTLYGSPDLGITNPPWEDVEGELIKTYITGDVILDLGCGNNKTVPHAIGVDMIPKDEVIETLSTDPKSVADVTADVSAPLPFEKGSVDTIIARHILEHLHNPIHIIKQWKSTLKSGGRLIIAVPDDTKNLIIPMNIEHKSAFTPDYMMEILGACGLEVKEIKDTNNFISFVAVAEKP